MEDIKQYITIGFKTALLWVNDYSMEDNNGVYVDDFSDDANLFIDNLIKQFIKDSNLESIYNELSGDSLEYTIGELLGHDLYLQVVGAGAGFSSSRKAIYGKHLDLFSKVCSKYIINDVYVSNDKIYVE